MIYGISSIYRTYKAQSAYGSFENAVEPDNGYNIVGNINHNLGNVYKPELKYFSFYVSDVKGVVRKVITSSPKPYGFENIAQVVLKGQLKGNEFFANDDILFGPPRKPLLKQLSNKL